MDDTGLETPAFPRRIQRIHDDALQNPVQFEQQLTRVERQSLPLI
jgi:hypothetical protein